MSNDSGSDKLLPFACREFLKQIIPWVREVHGSLMSHSACSESCCWPVNISTVCTMPCSLAFEQEDAELKHIIMNEIKMLLMLDL